MSDIQASYRVVVDAKKINSLFSALSDREVKKSVKGALRKSAGIIRKQAQRNLVSAAPGARTSSTKKGVTFRPLKNEINLAVYRNSSGARVDLLDKRKKNSRAYMLKFFELGTSSRATKKRGNKGSINAVRFLQAATYSKKREAESAIEQNLINEIRRIQNKNK